MKGFILKFAGSSLYFSHFGGVYIPELTLSIEPEHAWFTQDAVVAQQMCTDLKERTREAFEPFAYEHVSVQ